jgi:hypothetical protein
LLRWRAVRCVPQELLRFTHATAFQHPRTLGGLAMTRAMDKHDEHDRELTIVINAKPKVVPPGEMTFEQIVSLAYDGTPPAGGNWEFTVSYRRGHGKKPAGSLVSGQSVKLKDGMIFNVTATDKS